MPNPDPTTRGRRAWPIALAVLPALAALLWLGNDASWDLRNYHLYGPHAWLHGRQAIDIAAAQMQGYHNPLLDLPMYLLARAGAHPKLIGLWLALPAMFALWCLLRLQERLASPTVPTLGARLFLVVLALTGAATWSTLGLATDDAFVAAGMLGALVLLLDAPEAPEASASRCLCAGALAGATAGLKLAGAFYCPALALALLCLPGSSRTRTVRVLLLGAGGVLGFALSYGWWGWFLWQAHGNPFFPYFNQWFGSPDVLANSWVDLRFRPQGPVEMLLAPFRLLFHSRRFSEAGLKDPRLLLAWLGFAGLAWSLRAQAGATPAKVRALLVFVLAAALGWAWQSGIYRYAMALELLGALALAQVLARLSRWRAVAMLLALLLVSIDTRRPDWHRVESQAGPMPVLEAPLAHDALVVTGTGEPLGYVALALPDEVPMIGLDNNLLQPDSCSRLPRRAADLLQRHAGPIYLVVASDPAGQVFLRQRYGLAANGACIPVRSPIGEARLCPQERVAAPAEAPACPPI